MVVIDDDVEYEGSPDWGTIDFENSDPSSIDPALFSNTEERKPEEEEDDVDEETLQLKHRRSSMSATPSTTTTRKGVNGSK